MNRVVPAVALLLLSMSSSSAQMGKGSGSKSGWYNDYTAAKAEAKQSGKPILLVLRCEQCSDFAAIDDRVVRLDKEIADLADKFVRARQTRITGLDLRLFEFDYDLSWMVFFVNADDQIYGRFGGRDAVDPLGRLSLKGLRFAMEHALETHKSPPKPLPRTDKPLRTEDIVAAKRAKGGCVHCHNVNEFIHADLKKQGLWERNSIWMYPLPENVGLKLNIDLPNKIDSVLADSPAAKAGVKSGDILQSLNQVPVASFADATYGLHKGPKAGTIPIFWLHEGKEQSAKLEVADGWRRTSLIWRPSLLDYLPRLEFSGDDLKPEEKKNLGVPEKKVAFRQDKFVHSTLKAVGVRKDDVVIGIDGKELTGTMAQYLDYVRGNYLVGDRVTLDILREGKRIAVPMTLK